MSHVHELCLVKWLLAKNIRHCDLCKKKFVIKEEIGSFREIAKDFISQSLKSKQRIFYAVIYSLYVYFLGKRFFKAAKYIGKTIGRSLMSSLRAYLKLAVAEVKFIYKLLTLPWASNRLQTLREATKLWLSQIFQALTPSWILSIRSNPSRLGRIFQLFGMIKSVLTYIYVCIVFKQCLVIGINESLRLKRLVVQTINKSRRLRIKD